MDLIGFVVERLHDLFIFTRFENVKDYMSKKAYYKYIATLYSMSAVLSVGIVIGVFNMYSGIKGLNILSLLFGVVLTPLSIFLLVRSYHYLNVKYKVQRIDHHSI